MKCAIGLGTLRRSQRSGKHKKGSEKKFASEQKLTSTSPHNENRHTHTCARLCIYTQFLLVKRCPVYSEIIVASFLLRGQRRRGHGGRIKLPSSTLGCPEVHVSCKVESFIVIANLVINSWSHSARIRSWLGLEAYEIEEHRCIENMQKESAKLRPIFLGRHSKTHKRN